jgi:hypothetical protein
MLPGIAASPVETAAGARLERGMAVAPPAMWLLAVSWRLLAARGTFD